MAEERHRRGRLSEVRPGRAEAPEFRGTRPRRSPGAPKARAHRGPWPGLFLVDSRQAAPTRRLISEPGGVARRAAEPRPLPRLADRVRSAGEWRLEVQLAGGRGAVQLDGAGAVGDGVPPGARVDGERVLPAAEQRADQGEGLDGGLRGLAYEHPVCPTSWGSQRSSTSTMYRRVSAWSVIGGLPGAARRR